MCFLNIKTDKTVGFVYIQIFLCHAIGAINRIVNIITYMQFKLKQNIHRWFYESRMTLENIVIIYPVVLYTDTVNVFMTGQIFDDCLCREN